MRKLAVAFTVLLALSVPASAAKCVAETEANFWAMVEKAKFKPYTLTDAGQAKLRKVINSVRSRNNGELIPENAKFYFARLGGEVTGIVFMADGCVVPFSVMRLPSPAVAKLMHDAGVKDEEIILANVEA